MLRDLLDELQAALEPVAKSVTGERELARNHALPRFVFIRRKFKGSGATSIGGNPRSLRDRTYQVDVVCWGSDENEADRLTLALETASRTVFLGRNYSLDDGEFVADKDTDRGVVCVCELLIRVDTPLVRLEVGAPDDERPTTTATDAEVEKPAGTPDDDELEPGD